MKRFLFPPNKGLEPIKQIREATDESFRLFNQRVLINNLTCTQRHLDKQAPEHQKAFGAQAGGKLEAGNFQQEGVEHSTVVVGLVNEADLDVPPVSHHNTPDLAEMEAAVVLGNMEAVGRHYLTSGDIATGIAGDIGTRAEQQDADFEGHMEPVLGPVSQSSPLGL
ncbi:hypothetical protein OGATHE_004262 [Ogataea polymorpha]|uniref:Uncharacterized protein n=1 Tax=Ogataea polymorpha TaxID=460523 RepID=A0A9P8T1L9_9ASCO|nr:hypothetical protein OGATHE_004262 [Ogataea polymorpha]